MTLPTTRERAIDLTSLRIGGFGARKGSTVDNIHGHINNVPSVDFGIKKRCGTITVGYGTARTIQYCILQFSKISVP